MIPGAKGLKTRTESIIADEINLEVRTRTIYPPIFERSAPQASASIHIQVKHVETTSETSDKSPHTKYGEENEVAVTKPFKCPCNIL